MRNRYVKSVPVILAGALAGESFLVAEKKREPYHVEQQQYEEPSSLTYAVTSTATFVAGVSLLGPFSVNRETPSGSSFRVISTETPLAGGQT